MALYSGQALINIALTNLGVLEQGGTPSVSDSTDALTKLNLMIEQWRIQNRLIWSVGQASFALVAATASYTIGPTGAFATNRPDYIESAQIGYLGPNVTKQVVSPLKLISQSEYAGIRDLNTAAAIPERLYNDRGSPNSILYLWPVPRVASATNLILYTWAQLLGYASLITSNDLPDGYAEGIANALAVRLIPSFGAAIAPEVAQWCSQIALQAENKISDLNSIARALMQSQGGQQPTQPGRPQ